MVWVRADGRTADELRPVTITPGFLRTAPGAVLIEMGNTKVICTVFLEPRVPPFLVGSGKGWLTAEYGMLPGAGQQRIPREAATGRPNGRNREIQRLIGRVLRTAVDLTAIGERTLAIDCDVIQADGGTRTASITGAYVALAEAVQRLSRDGQLTGSPLRERVAAVSVGLVEDQALLDLCYQEDARAQTDMNVAMTADGGIVEIQGTAEGKAFTRQQVEHMLDLASGGIERLQVLQQQAVNSLR